MLKLSQREGFLSRKIACSLLMASTISVCISGGDAWAFETVKLTQDTIYHNSGEIPTAIEMNGHNITSYIMFGDGTANRELLGTNKEKLTILGDDTYQYGIGAYHGENSKINISNIKEIDISGAWKSSINGSALYTNAKGAITLNNIGVLKIENSVESGIGIHTMAGIVKIQADSVIIAGKKDVLYDRAILAQLSGSSDASNDKAANVDINADNIDFHTSGIAVAAVNWNEAVSNNFVEVNLKAKNISIISDNSTGLSSYSYNFNEQNDNMTGKTSIILDATEFVTIKGAKNAVYTTNGRNLGDALISIDAGKDISIAGNTNALYSGFNALVKINDGGTAKVSLTGNVVAENGGQIIVKNADQTGAIYAAAGGDVKITSSGTINAVADRSQAIESSARSGAIVADSADIIIEAENIKASNRSVSGDDRVYGIVLENGGNITLRGNIDVKAYGGNGVQSRAVRNNGGGTFSAVGIVNILADAQDTDTVAVGVDVWNSGKAGFSGKETNVTALGGTDAYGVQVQSNAGAVFAADNTVIDARITTSYKPDEIAGPKPDGYGQWANGVYVSGITGSDGITFSSKSLTVNANTNPLDNELSCATALRSEGYGKITIGDNVTTVLNAESDNGTAIGIWTSYYTKAAFGGEKLTINSISKSGDAIGTIAVWSPDVVYSAKDTVINAVSSTGNAYGVDIDNHTQSLPDSLYPSAVVNHTGNVTIGAQSQDKEAFGVYVHSAKPNKEESSDQGGAANFSKDLNIKAVSANSNATGIFVSGAPITDENDQVLFTAGQAAVNVLGNTTIVASGKTASYALHAADGGQITVGSMGKNVHLTGNIVAEANGIININGKINTVNGSIKAVDGGIISMNGTSDAVYNNIDINSFVTKGTDSNGKVNFSGGTMNFGTLVNQNLADNSFVASGGTLKAASKDIFTNGLTEAGTAIASGDVLSVVNNAVKFESGKLILSDAKYNLAWLKTAQAALNRADNGTMGIVVAGTLVTADGEIQTEASASDLAETGAVHAGVTGKVDTNDVIIGSSGLENLGVKDLALGGSVADTSKVTVGNSKELTLVGSGSENDALVKTSDGTAKTNVAVAVGDSANAGTLNLGVAGMTSGGNLNAAVAIANDNSKVNVDAGTFKVNKISADKGTISVNEGAALKTDSLTVGSSGSTVKLSGTGALEAQSMTVNTGTIEVTGTAKAGNLTVTDSNAIINVGTGNSAGSLAAGNADLNGAAVVLDPVWQGNDTIGNASKAALAFTNNNVNGLMTVGRNSVLSLGTDDTGKAEQAFAESELTWGETGVSAALYIDQAQKLQVQGGILLDGTKTAAAAEANKAIFADGSLLIVNGSGIGTNGIAALTGETGSTLKVSPGAKLYLTSTNAGTYTIAKGFTSTTFGGWSWSADTAAVDVSVNKLSEIEKIEKNTTSGDFTVTVRQTDIQKKYDGIALPHILQAMDQSRTEYAGIKYLTYLANDNKLDKEGFIAAVNSFAQGAENSGATRTGALAALDLGTAVQEHLSLAKAAAEQSGGFGKAAVDTADNGGIWAQYIHNKDKVDNMGGVSYDGQYNGVIIGGDFADRGKYSSGIAFSYGSGDSTGSASKNEFDFWGLSYYGGIQNGDTNLIFDVGYSKTSSDVKGVIKAEPDTQVISMGIKGEKVISNGHGTSYVPYAGLRYMNIDTDSYNGSIDGKAAAHYSTDKADLWLLPVGISISHESVTAGGWKVRPTADIAYVWTLGDKNTAMDITVPGVNATDRLGYDIMDSGFFVGKLGLEAEKGDWTYGLGYACQKGSHAQNSKFMLNVTYSF
ncbi:autotransporter domain-containing protein [Phascolarctobacterium faecium]|uniref:autotransporter domain-containing protein n=1 Tax=Phascolarctobacterium faecium TaxID=33025 RepID=UPI003AB55123